MTTAMPEVVLADQAARDQIVSELDRCVAVLASAGSGKTKSLVDRMVALIETGRAQPGDIAAITFTKKAAGELRGRFVNALSARAGTTSGEAKIRLGDALKVYDQAYVGTIHGFCSQMLRQKPFAAGVTPDFVELDEREELKLRREAWFEFMDRVAEDEPGRIQQLVSLRLGPADLLAAFGVRYEYADLPLKQADPNQDEPDLSSTVAALAIQLTRSKARLSPAADRNNASVVRLLKSDQILETLVDASSAEIADYLMEWESPKFRVKKDFVNSTGKTLNDPIANLLAEPLRCWREYVYSIVAPLLDEGLAFYSEKRRDLGLMSFDDLLLRTHRMLATKKEVADFFRSRTKYLLIDEFQDTDPVQSKIALYLTSDNWSEDWRSLRPTPGSLFVVGDDKQSIYRFRRADIRIFKDVVSILEESGGLVLRLEQSFRSRASLTKKLNDTFSIEFQRSASSTQAVAASLVPYYEDEMELGPILRIFVDGRFGSPQEEALIVAGYIAECLAGNTELRDCKPSDFLILATTNSHLGYFAKELENLGIPVDLTGGERMGQSIDLRYLVAILDSIARPDNPVSFLEVLRGPMFSFTDPELEELFRDRKHPVNFTQPISKTESPTTERFNTAVRIMQEFERALTERPACEAIELILDQSGLLACAAAGSQGDSRAGTLIRYLNFARQLEASGLDWIQILNETHNLIATDEKRFYMGSLSASSGNAVRIMNIHQAKGLEACVVFLMDRAKDSSGAVKCHFYRGEKEEYLSLPITTGSRLRGAPPGWEQDRTNEKGADEEQKLRLKYVAATRAKELLVVSVNPTSSTSGVWSALRTATANADDLPLKVHPSRQPAKESRYDLEEIVKANLEQLARQASPVISIENPSKESGSLHELEGLGTEYGTTVHELLELCVVHPEMDSNTITETVVKTRGWSTAAAESLRDVVPTFKASRLYKNINEAESVFTEVPVADAADGESTIRRGTIDLIYKNKSGWHIVDYKTQVVDTPEKEATLARAYGGQVAAYADMWEKITGEPATSCSLYVASTGKSILVK